MYKVVLDENASYIEEVESGMSFSDAVNSILEYARDHSYDLQEIIWGMILNDGEDKFETQSVLIG